jgi:hypothetical protein
MPFCKHIMTNLVYTKSSGSKRHAVAFTVSVFAGKGGGVVKLVYTVIVIHLSQLRADLPLDLWAIQPTSCETTDFKKTISVRVESEVLKTDK